MPNPPPSRRSAAASSAAHRHHPSAASSSVLSMHHVLCMLFLVVVPNLLLLPPTVTAQPTLTTSVCAPLPPNRPCLTFKSWSEFSRAVETWTGDLILCPGTVLTKTASDKQATMKRALRLACGKVGACTVRGLGRHLNIKTIGGADTTIQGIKFEGADFTSVSIFDRATGRHAFCDNEFIDNSRPMDSQQGGGAIKAAPKTNLVIERCTFRGNSAPTGGALSLLGVYARIVDTVFERNLETRGGAIESRSTLDVGSSTFIDNSATERKSSTILLLERGRRGWNDLGNNAALTIDAGSLPSASFGCLGFYDGTSGSEECHTFLQPPPPAWEPLPVPEASLPLELGELYRDPTTKMQVARGLKIESVARAGRSVQYTNGQDSGKCEFHYQPDGAATFYDPTINEDGGFHYCTNSELDENGGVYCLEFDAECRVKDYKKRLGGSWNDGCGSPPGDITTRWNCNGGATPWNTWVSCEEHSRGYCWQVDPYGKRDPEPIYGIGTGSWEAMAVDNRNSQKPVFYFTEDHSEGAIRQFTPNSLQADNWKTLHSGGELRFLVFDDKERKFEWSTDLDKGRESANDYYENVEGIIFMEINGEGHLFFVSKDLKMLFDLNLDQKTDTSHSTKSGLSDGGSFLAQPDALAAIGTNWIWHTEDGGSTPGCYIKNLQTDEYFTIFQDDNPIDDDGGEETTGIAISPNGKCMIGCLQERGECYTLKREDGGSLEHLELRLRMR